MQSYLWSDEYSGPRFTYYSPLRPMSVSLLPNGFTTVIELDQDERIVVTTEPLPESFVTQASLELRS